ncbi:hypothetical protein ACFZCY_01705 [Streptomyces sp. NPDC007983]|uniref:hypothetical protein n=1 Tax=Streptomyces sp. NPDC007983 TaxID=3364800 RepID=UPI0036E46DE4
MPWTTLIALRFARMRRSLLYAAVRSPFPGFTSLHRTVVWTVGQLDATDHQRAWCKEGGREFDGAFTGDDGVEVWYEAKSGKYWELANETPKVMEKFKSNLGDARLIAEEGGRKFSLISEKPIPENIVKWFDKKNYTWRVIPKGAG